MRRINRHSVVACLAGAACGLVGASAAAGAISHGVCPGGGLPDITIATAIPADA